MPRPVAVVHTSTIGVEGVIVDDLVGLVGFGKPPIEEVHQSAG
jgi:hypothetical protein